MRASGVEAAEGRVECECARAAEKMRQSVSLAKPWRVHLHTHYNYESLKQTPYLMSNHVEQLLCNAMQQTITKLVMQIPAFICFLPTATYVRTPAPQWCGFGSNWQVIG